MGTLYQVTRKAIHFLRERYPDERFRDEAPRIHFATLAHDLLLSDTLRTLQFLFPQAKLTHGKLLGVPSRHGERGPDAIMTRALGKNRVAIELELTAKSELRYRQIILQYRLSQEYSAVLYVTGSQEISNKLKTQIIGYKAPQGALTTTTGRFYFVPLNTLLKDPSFADLSNGSAAPLSL